jgi:hypothetical protein
MQVAWITSNDFAGLAASSALAAHTRRVGDLAMVDSCAGCGFRASVMAGTIFDRTRTPLTVWLTACWLFATARDGVSALSLQRSLEIGSYQTAWTMLHRLRSVLMTPGRDRVSGGGEVDETYIGGEEPGLSGGRAKGKKVLVGFGRGQGAQGVRPVPNTFKRVASATFRARQTLCDIASDQLPSPRGTIPPAFLGH